jgi:hypothetical protein
MTPVTITLPFAGTELSIETRPRCDASSDLSIDLGEILTTLIIADKEFYRGILIARQEFRQGKTLTHEEVFGTD